MDESDRNTPALYDDPAFFAAYEAFRAQDGRPNEVIEAPALLSLLPNPKGLIAADLGCGNGAMCRWLISQGAASVIGFDAAEKMLARARQLTPYSAKLDYRHADLNLITLGINTFDLIVSGLALHYIEDFRGLAAKIAAALRADGSFVFSVEHPVVSCNSRAWICGDDGSRKHWPVDRYLEEGSRHVDWLGFPDVPREHRSVSAYVNTLLESGLSLSRLLEPGPTDADIAKWPHIADHRRRPSFLVIRAQKPS